MQKRGSAMSSPASPVQPDREAGCLLALVPAFRGLVQSAEDAGWTGEEVAVSLIALAYAYDSRLPETGLLH